MSTILELNQTHPNYDALEADDLWAMYKGGKDFEKRKARFLKQWLRESEKMYSLRLDEAEYRNYIGAIIKHFAALLFTSKPVAQAYDSKDEQILDPHPYWAELREDCDRTGMDVDQFFKAAITEAMVKGRSWIAVLQPSDNLVPAENKLEFEQRGLGDCWLKHLDYNSVLDWETDEDGNLDWILVHDSVVKRPALGGKRNAVTETWTHYQRDRIDYYQIKYDAEHKPDRNTVVPLVLSVPHSLGKCPIVCLELTEADQVASVLKSPALSNFRRVSGQNWSIACSCFAQPVAKVADKDAFAQMIVSAGYGIVIGETEDFTWVSPDTAHLASSAEQINATKDEIFRLAFQMALGVENNAAAVGRTAESKSQDAQSTRVALTSYGRIVKQTIERVYDMIATIRGEDMDWDVIGLDDFAGIDTAGFITLAMNLQAAGGIPSIEFNSQLKQKLAESVLPDLDESVKATIREEIDTSVKTAPTQQEQELQLFAAQHAIVAGDTAAGGLLAPQTKSNATKNKGGAKPFAGPKPKKPSSGGSGSTGEFVKAKKPGGK